MAHVERKLGDGEIDVLLKKSSALYQQAAVGKDVMIVEAMVPTRQANYAARINLQLAKSLNAEVILVAAPESDRLGELADRVEIQAQSFSDPQESDHHGRDPQWRAK
jgi:phosphate acetyltransferase